MKMHGPYGPETEISEEAVAVWRSMNRALMAIGSPCQKQACALRILVDGGHSVIHELLDTGLLQLDVWSPGMFNGEARVN